MVQASDDDGGLLRVQRGSDDGSNAKGAGRGHDAAVVSAERGEHDFAARGLGERTGKDPPEQGSRVGGDDIDGALQLEQGEATRHAVVDDHAQGSGRRVCRGRAVVGGEGKHGKQDAHAAHRRFFFMMKGMWTWSSL